MNPLIQTNPDVWHVFEERGIMVNINSVTFIGIVVDQAHKHVNKAHKKHWDTGGISNDPEALLILFGHTCTDTTSW